MNYKIIKKRSLSIIGLFSISCCLIISACSKHDDTNDYPYGQIVPKGAKPSWGPTITAQMQTVIEELDSLAPTPIYLLTPQQARLQPSAADAVKKVMQNYGIATPTMNYDTTGKDIPVQGGTIHLRLYTPRTGKSTYPVIVYYHGGGWVIATIDTYNASAQALAEQVNAIVVSVEYRKGPEYKFPTAHKDSYAAYKWVLQNAFTFKGDSTKVAVAGESAGGNLAVTVSMMARDSGFKKPLHIVSIYPVASADTATASKIKYAVAKPLNKPSLNWFFSYFLNTPADAMNPLLNLVAANLFNLPPTTIINAEIDPLQTEGQTLTDKLQAAGVSVEHRLYNGVTHEFFGIATVLPEAKDAQAYAAQRLINAFK